MKYIQNLNTEEKPVVLEYGDGYAHVPINIQEVEGVDEDGNAKTTYTCDMVEKVATPITAASILAAAIAGKYEEAELTYIKKNASKTSNTLVSDYNSFVSEVTALIAAAGYE